MDTALKFVLQASGWDMKTWENFCLEHVNVRNSKDYQETAASISTPSIWFLYMYMVSHHFSVYLIVLCHLRRCVDRGAVKILNASFVILT